MLEDLTLSTWAVVFATLLGPVLAVQAQKWVERATDNKRRRFAIFNTLMVTRGTRLDFEHVRALNSIDIEFRNDPEVIEAWRLYVVHLNFQYHENNEAQSLQWQMRGNDLFIELLVKISKAVDVKVERERLLGAYHPKGHYQREMSQLEVLKHAAAVFAGKQSLKMSVVELPFSAEATQAQVDLHKKLGDALTGGVVHVELKTESGTQ